jgi:hypothetical protein
MVPSTSFNRSISLTRMPTPRDAVEPVRFSYPFDGLRPLRSHVFPHFVAIRAAEQWLRHPFAYDDNAEQVLGKQANLTKSQVSSMMGRIYHFHFMWTFNTKKFSGHTAPHWLSPRCNHAEGLESTAGRRRPGLDSPGVSEPDLRTTVGTVEAAGESDEDQEGEEDVGDVDDEDDEDDDDEGPRPFPGVPEADPDIRVLKWIRHSNAHLSSQKVGPSHRRPAITDSCADYPRSGSSATCPRSFLPGVRPRAFPALVEDCQLGDLSSFLEASRLSGRLQCGRRRPRYSHLRKHGLGSIRDGHGDLVGDASPSHLCI